MHGEKDECDVKRARTYLLPNQAQKIMYGCFRVAAARQRCSELEYRRGAVLSW